MSDYLIAHDLGTSGDKATLFTTAGTLVRSCVIPYEANFFGQNCAEQNASDWWQAVCLATRTILEDIPAASVAAVSFSAQMQGCLAVDRDGEPLRPSIIWADHRAAAEAALLDREIGFDRIYEITGHRLSPSYTLEKIMWLKQHESDLYRNTHKILQAKDYIIFKLTGNFVTDYSDASGTNALDLDRLDWSEEILAASGIDKELLPRLHQSTDVVGTVTAEAAAATGLATGTPIVCGGGDGPCAAVGAGCIHENQLFTTFGTSAWIGGTTKAKFLDRDKVFFCFAHVIPDRYMPCGTMQAAGSSYSYIRRLLGPDQSYQELNELIAASPVGAGKLLFLPYMLGERSPRWNEHTSGAFLGIKMHHDKKDYLRAVIEGVAYNLELILQAYRRYLTVDGMILTGGGAKGDIVCQILADVFNTVLQTPDHVEEATSIAAAVIAGVGTGVYSGFEDITRFLSFRREYHPDTQVQPVYGEMKKLFDDSYYTLEKLFAKFE